MLEEVDDEAGRQTSLSISNASTDVVQVLASIRSKRDAMRSIATERVRRKDAERLTVCQARPEPDPLQAWSPLQGIFDLVMRAHAHTGRGEKRLRTGRPQRFRSRYAAKLRHDTGAQMP